MSSDPTRESGRTISPDARIRLRDSHHVRACWRNFAVVLWTGETIPSAVVGVRELIAELNDEHPGNVGLIQLVGADALPPTSAARKALDQMFAASGSMLQCSTVVFDGDGFRAAAVRGIATGLALLARHEFPHSVLSNLEDAAALHEKHVRRPDCPWTSAAELVDVVNSIRADA